MRGIVLGVFLATAGCSGTTASAPTLCNKSDRHGVYLVEMTKISGTCHTPGSFLVDIDAPPDPKCTVVAPAFSRGDCHFEGVIKCPDVGGQGIVTSTASITQETQDGSVLEGTFTIDQPTCLGTFDVKYTRR